MMILHKMTIKWLLLHSRIGFKDYDFEYENDHWRRRWWEERRPSPGASKSSSSAPRTRRWPSTYYVITTTRMMVTFGKNARNCSLTRSSRALSALWGRWQTWCSSSPRWVLSFFKLKSNEPTTHVAISGAGPFCCICKPLLSHRGSNSLRDWVQDAHSEVPTCPRSDHDHVHVANHRDF